MKIISGIIISTACITSMFLVNFHAYSQGNIHLGPLEIHPSLLERIEFDDNIYQVSGKGENVRGREDKESDMINIFTPGLKLFLPFRGTLIPSASKGHNLSFDWHSDFKNYKNHADQDQQNHYFNASGKLGFPRGFDLTLEDIFEDTEEPAGSETDKIHPRKTNTVDITINLPDYFRRFDIEFKYTNFDQEYDQRSLSRANRNEDRFSLKIPFKLTPKITLFPEYTFGFTEYDQSSASDSLSDSHFNEIFAGAEWYATAKTTGILKLGYRSRDYDNNMTSDINTFVANLGIKSNLTRRTAVNLDLSRSQHESEFTAGSNAYLSSGGNLDVSHKINKLTATLSGNYGKQVYRGSSRRDDIYGFRLSSKYDIKEWTFVNFYYSYRDKHSNFDSEDDRINRASIGIGVEF